MSLALVVDRILNAIAQSALLFLVAVGLSLVFGVLRVVNFAHGVFYMLGAYLGFTVVARSGSFWLSLVLAPVATGLLGGLLERTTLRYIYRRPPIYQLLLTFGLALVLEELVRVFWGPSALPVDPPAGLEGAVTILGAVYPRYRLFLVVLGMVTGVALWLFLQRTRAGLVIRAAAQNDEMALGAVQAIEAAGKSGQIVACALAAVGGVAAAPMTTAYLGMGIGVIVDAFVVVVIGGLGSIVGSMAGSLIVGTAQTWGGFYFSEAAMAIMYLVMGLVLIFRPWGLFGEEE